MTRQVVLDTETTGLEAAQGHRIVEIGCVEIQNRRIAANDFQCYLNPDRDSDPGALQVHGLTRAFLSDKPRFTQIAPRLLDYLRGAEVLIHNAAFDAGFINAELARAGIAGRLEDIATVVDTWALAKQKHPGQKNNLNALCERYQISTAGREFHGALKDARLLADVYLAMTAGQNTLGLEAQPGSAHSPSGLEKLLKKATGLPLPVVRASGDELQRHVQKLQAVAKAASKASRPLIWRSELGEGVAAPVPKKKPA